jgi:hypothetical protein
MYVEMESGGEDKWQQALLLHALSLACLPAYLPRQHGRVGGRQRSAAWWRARCVPQSKICVDTHAYTQPGQYVHRGVIGVRGPVFTCARASLTAPSTSPLSLPADGGGGRAATLGSTLGRSKPARQIDCDLRMKLQGSSMTSLAGNSGAGLAAVRGAAGCISSLGVGEVHPSTLAWLDCCGIGCGTLLEIWVALLLVCWS